MENCKYTDDSLAIILLCSNLAIDSKVDEFKPFTALEWSKFAKILFNSSIKMPSNLFNLSEDELEKNLLISKKEAQRIVKLLSKAGRLTFELNNLNNMGINILTRADSRFPKVLRDKLQDKCPPLLYYCGDINILNEKLIGVVGSRDIDEVGLNFTKKISKKIVSENYSLVSGGAKGVDSIAQDETLKSDGKVVAVLADSMIQKIKKKEIREAIMNRKLLVMSEINPNARFTVYHAMNRNKYIYALSDFAVVVSSDFNKGGTWAGATENIKNSWVPTLVRIDDKSPKGNKELEKLGAIKISEEVINTQFIDLVSNVDSKETIVYDYDLFSLAKDNLSNEDLNKEIEISKEFKENKLLKEVNLKDYLNVNNEDDKKIEEVKKESSREPKLRENEKNFDAYNILLQNIIEALSNELTPEEFAQYFNVNKTQGNSWLKRAVEDGIAKKLTKPVRYIKIGN